MNDGGTNRLAKFEINLLAPCLDGFEKIDIKIPLM